MIFSGKYLPSMWTLISFLSLLPWRSLSTLKSVTINIFHRISGDGFSPIRWSWFAFITHPTLFGSRFLPRHRLWLNLFNFYCWMVFIFLFIVFTDILNQIYLYGWSIQVNYMLGLCNGLWLLTLFQLFIFLFLNRKCLLFLWMRYVVFTAKVMFRWRQWAWTF